MKDLLNEVQASVMMEYGRAKDKFGAANNSNHESYAVIKEEFEEAKEALESFSVHFDCFWDAVRNNEKNKALLHLGPMREWAEKAAGECIQVAAMCYKATKEPGGTE